MPSELFIQQLKQYSDIEQIVSSYVPLKKKGRYLTGLCPFHSEKTPSFFVYPQTQSFYCFGCGAGGDVITFIRRIENLEYMEAVRLLAERCGLQVPDDAENDHRSQIKKRVLEINRETARFYFDALMSPQGKEAYNYLIRRGRDRKTIRHFGLGYSPKGWDELIRHLKSKGFSEEEMLEANVAMRGRRGKPFDRFRNRVMFPIIDLRGNVIAFGGRVMDDSKPKYVNSPETLVYHKSDTVFALQIAKKSASRRYVLCEGYMDVISMQQAGIDTAVCACGTALTQNQVKLLSEYADEVILSYDSDEAGQKATLRSLELFRNSPVQVGVLNIPNAKDPDEYIKKFGPERFRQLLDGAGNALEFRLARARAKYDLKQDTQRLEYIQEAVSILADGSTPTEKELYAGRLAEETNLSKTAVMAQLDLAVRKEGARRRSARQKEILHSGEMDTIKLPFGKNGPGALGAASSQRWLVAAALRQPEYLKKIAPALKPEGILNEDLREGYQAILRCYEQGREVSLGAVAGEIGEKALNELSAAAAEYSHVSCTPQDIEMHLERIARGAPRSAQAGGMSDQELTDYIAQIRQRKGGGQTEQEE